MICLGKSVNQVPSNIYDKQNNPQAANHNLQDKPLKYTKLGLNKKLSDQTTQSSSKTNLENHGLLLKRQYSQQIADNYADAIFNSISSDSIDTSQCLKLHTISSTLRSRMVDWMIQVLGSYKMSEQSYFKSVSLMDGYLKKQKISQTNKSIHLTGVACMFIATKYQQIYPLRLKHLVEKVSRNKFAAPQIIQRQSRVIETLNFDLEFPTIFDIVKHLFHQIKLGMPHIQAYFYRILIYLSKMCMIDEQLSGFNHTLLGCSIFFIGLKTLEQTEARLIPEQILGEITRISSIAEFQIINTGRMVLNLAKNFSRLYPQLSNLKKFNKFTFPCGKQN